MTRLVTFGTVIVWLGAIAVAVLTEPGIEAKLVMAVVLTVAVFMVGAYCMSAVIAFEKRL